MLQTTHVDLLVLFSHDLLAGVVNEDVQTTVFGNVGFNSLLAVLLVHNVEREQEALAAVGFDSLLDVLSADP